MAAPAELARDAEKHPPQLPVLASDRMAGYGVMGLPFRSGHILGLRRWTATSIGEGFTSIWHRNPAGQWTFYESGPLPIACTRYFGADVERVQVGPIAIEWEGDDRLRIRTADSEGVDWRLGLGSTPLTRAMSLVGAALPVRAWRSQAFLRAMGRLAGWSLGLGTVNLTGMTSNQQHFDANPLRIWFVTDSNATVEGEALGPIGPVADQAHLGDFYIPQRGVFAVGRVFVTPA